MNGPSTLSAIPRPTGAAIAAVLLLALGRTFFLCYPGAFDAFPETQVEYVFYEVDLRCKALRPESQIILQGTSRLLTLRSVPLFAGRWHTRDHVSNISQPLNTFWHMNLLHRRNPGLLDKADLWIIDVLPMQTRVDVAFPEHDSLFLRESTLEEKLLVNDTADRLRALLDWIIPLWSHHHEAIHWLRALSTLHASAQEKFETIKSIDVNRLPDLAGRRARLSTDPEAWKETFIRILYPAAKPISHVQLAAFNQLLTRVPLSAHVLLFHPPFRQDFAEMLARSEGGTLAKDEMHRFVDAQASKRVHVEWYEASDALDFVEVDYASDGVHPSPAGDVKLAEYFKKCYRRWIP